MSQNRKVVKYRRPFKINIGVIIYGVIFVYLLISVIAFMNKKKLSVYEVISGTIAEAHTYEGFILRQEEIVLSPKGGYVNYFLREGDRTSKYYTICTIDETGFISDNLNNTSQDSLISKENYGQLKGIVKRFNQNYSDTNYNQIYYFKEEFNNKILEFTNLSRTENLEGLLSKVTNPNTFHQLKTPSSGIVSYIIDGYEDVGLTQIDNDLFTVERHEKKQLLSNAIIEADTPAYKVLPSEAWSIVFPITPEEQLLIGDRTRLTIKMHKDGETLTGPIQVFTQNGQIFVKLDFTSSLIQYLSERFVKFDIVFKESKGLKIPNSAVAEKDFYLVPIDYLSYSGNSRGFNRERKNLETGEMTISFVSADLYHSDDNYYYVDTSTFQVLDSLIKPDSQDRYTVSTTQKLKGVYSVNRGFATFRLVDIIDQNDAYTIIHPNTTYGVSQYDHIIINAEDVEENEITY